MILLQCKLIQIGVCAFHGCVIMDDIGTRFCGGMRLIGEHLVKHMLVVKVVLWMWGHFLALLSDFGLGQQDVNPDLLKEDSSNDKIATKGVFHDNAFHSFALASQQEFREHDVMKMVMLCA